MDKEIIGWQIQLSKHQMDEVRREPNKDYAVGYLIGKATPIWAQKNEDKNHGEK